MLAAGHALDGAAQDFGLVGGGVEREGEQGAVPGIAEEHPEPDRFELFAERAEGRNRSGTAARSAVCRGKNRHSRRRVDERTRFFDIRPKATGSDSIAPSVIEIADQRQRGDEAR
jgi:hypothetical protein